MAERAIELMCRRAPSRVAFGKPLAEQGVVHDWIADSRVRIEQLRLLVLKTAWLMDTVGNKGAHTEIQAIKIATPATVEWILDKAIQVHGAGGLSPGLPAGRRCGPASARCGSPTVRTRCTRTPWPRPSCASRPRGGRDGSDSGRAARSGRRVPGRAPDRDDRAERLPARPLRRRAGVGGVPRGARRSRRVARPAAAGVRRSSTAAGPPTTTRDATGSGSAWPRRRS